MKSLVRLIPFILTAAFLLLPLYPVLAAPPTTYTLVGNTPDCHYATIGEALAIGASNPNNEIRVMAGTYTEDLVIAKPVTIKPETGAAVTLSGSVQITSGGVTLSGFTVALPVASAKQAAISINQPAAGALVAIQGCNIPVPAGKTGIAVDGARAALTVSANTITTAGATAASPAAAAFTVAPNQPAGVPITVSQNQVKGYFATAFTICSKTTLLTNTIESQGGGSAVGVAMSGQPAAAQPYQIQLSGNTIKGFGIGIRAHGVRSASADVAPVITGNTFTGNTVDIANTFAFDNWGESTVTAIGNTYGTGGAKLSAAAPIVTDIATASRLAFIFNHSHHYLTGGVVNLYAFASGAFSPDTFTYNLAANPGDTVSLSAIPAKAGTPVTVTVDGAAVTPTAPYNTFSVSAGSVAAISVGTSPATATYYVAVGGTAPDLSKITAFSLAVSKLPLPASATLAAKAQTDALLAQYNAFTPAEKALVPAADIQKLNDLSAKFLTLTQQADAVTAAIIALPAPSATTTAHQAQVKAALALYNALSAEQKKLISATNLKKLQDCVTKVTVTINYTIPNTSTKIAVTGLFEPSWRLEGKTITRTSATSDMWYQLDRTESGYKASQIFYVNWKANGALPNPTNFSMTVSVSSSVALRKPYLMALDARGVIWDAGATFSGTKFSLTPNALGYFGIIAKSGSSSYSSYDDDDDDDYGVDADFSELRSDIQSASLSSTLKINVAGDNPIPTSVFTALASRGGVNVSFYAPRYIWTVNGSQIVANQISSGRVYYDLAVGAGSGYDDKIDERFQSATIGPQTFSTTYYKGALPGTFTLSLHSNIYPGIKVNVYLYKTDGSYILLASGIKVGEDGWVTFKTATAGTYVITNGTISAAVAQPASSAATSRSAAPSVSTPAAPSSSSAASSSSLAPESVSLPEESSSSSQIPEIDTPVGPVDPTPPEQKTLDIGTIGLICAGVLALFAIAGVVAAIISGRKGYKGL